ncbi:PilW family protein [Neptuniibacter halophilus]|uniref:PilW family protein n=1 Tax=Neptuniibacter halophilus TaxID=651666 RepID=UPI0025734C9D|nr:PilW family protein [Neptuniibacter halophilus]
MKGYRISHQAGFSLVELMIALLLGLLLMAGVLQIFSSSSVTYSVNMALANLQDNGRIAMALLTRDLRLTGYSGCSAYTSQTNIIRTDGSQPVDYLDLEPGINGQNDLGSVRFGSRTTVPGSDLLEVRYAGSESCVIRTHNPASAVMHCEENHAFSPGEVLVATDCSHSAIFMMSGPDNPGNTIVHNSGNGSSIGNCSKGLGPDVDCSSTLGEQYAFNLGTVRRLKFARYFIAANDREGTSLYRQSIQRVSGIPVLRSNELVEGVEDMQILYGEDTDKDGTANRYIPFDRVADRDEIVSVRVSLLLQTTRNNIAKAPQILHFNGVQQRFDDGRLRKVFSSTIALRNKLL